MIRIKFEETKKDFNGQDMSKVPLISFDMYWSMA